MKDTELLDAQELMHLALEATALSRTGQAMEYLKRLLALKPDDADAHYLLGAQQAQVGMFDRAIASMQQAITLRPGLDAARFQLGMLLLTSTRLEEARAVWKPLDQLGAEHPYYLFKTGLLMLAEDQFEACIAHLEQGMARNHENAPLNEDMARMIARIRGDHPAPAGQAAADQEQGVPSIFLDAYAGKAH